MATTIDCLKKNQTNEKSLVGRNMAILTTWSPELRVANRTFVIAAIPEENNNVPCPPSKLLSVWAAASTVGFIQREYTQPLWKEHFNSYNE